VKKKLIENFLRNECNPHENLELLEWLMRSDYEGLEDLIEYDLNKELTKEVDSEKDLCHLLPEIYNSEDHVDNASLYQPSGHFTPVANADKKSNRSLWFIVKCAASIFFIAGISYLFYSNLSKTQPIQSGEYTDLVTKSNQRGRKSTIHLKDGSIIYLNSESKITYPNNFSDSIRVVRLEGEAFFVVAKNSSNPFNVIAGPLQVEVLGTSFNIKALNDEDEIKISLASGQVVLFHETDDSKIEKKLSLSPNQAVVFSLDENVFNDITGFEVIEEFGWKDGIIYFNKAGLVTVLNKLEQWYNVSFDVKNDPLSIWSYTGTFKNATLENVLNSIGHTEGFSFSIDHDKVIIKFNSDNYDPHS